MSETRKLYYEDVYQKEFTAEVLECRETDRGYEVVLDQTAFYPEGGGQPCDLGTLNGISVVDVQEKGSITRFNLTNIQLEPERVNISRMLEQIGFEFHPILAEKDLKLETEIKPNVEILCDPDKLARVFDNLLRNAVNYSYAGTTIYLSMDYEPIKDEVKICVKNHGKTISPDKLDRIFDQFFRLDSSRRSSTTPGSTKSWKRRALCTPASVPAPSCTRPVRPTPRTATSSIPAPAGG